jgi:hypothetical protein
MIAATTGAMISTILACFYCGVDSTPLIVFFALIVGSGVLSLCCFIGWAILNGHHHDEGLAAAALEAEREEIERRGDA